jgi:hypothetical protein
MISLGLRPVAGDEVVVYAAYAVASSGALMALLYWMPYSFDMLLSIFFYIFAPIMLLLMLTGVFSVTAVRNAWNQFQDGSFSAKVRNAVEQIRAAESKPETKTEPKPEPVAQIETQNEPGAQVATPVRPAVRRRRRPSAMPEGAQAPQEAPQASPAA